MAFVYLCRLFKISKNEKTFLLNEQRSMDTAAQKELIQVEYIGKSNNYYEEYYKYPHYNNYYFSLLHLY